MAATVIYNDQVSTPARASAEGDNLWIAVDELRAASGWELKPQGACLGEVCVPIPAARAAEFVREGGARFNLAALARLLGQPIAHHDATATWFFGAAPERRRNALLSLQAPDFTLPDLDGRMHSLSDYRGKKILLASWASW